MHYRSLIESALQLTWKHKYIWILGFFAALLGNGGELNILINTIASYSPPLAGPDYLPAIFQSPLIPTIVRSAWIIISSPAEWITAGGILLVASIIAYGAFIAQTGIIHWAFDTERKSDSLKRHIQAGVQQGARVIGIHAVHVGVMLLCVSVIAFPVIGILKLTGALSPQTSAIVFAIILLPCGLISHALRKFSIIELFTKKQRSIGAIITSYKIFLSHWKQTLEFIAFLLCASVILSFSYITALIIVLFPLASVGIVLVLLELATSGFIVLGATGLLAVAGLCIFGAFWAVCTHVAWVSCYQRLQHPTRTKFKERIEHLISFHISRS